jgi:ribosomal protein L29
MKALSALREKSTEELLKLLEETRTEKMPFLSTKREGQSMMKLPSGASGTGNTSWGLSKKLKVQIARIKTILAERGVEV